MEQRLLQIDAEIEQSLSSARERSLPVGGDDLQIHNIMQYHLGLLDEQFDPVMANQGKRVRPLLALLSCEANGGDATTALPLAAAIELLHNFTLIHDDIQDKSEERRHRPAVWTKWGQDQAINAGDAMFAVAYIALHRLVDRGVEPAQVLKLSTDMHRTTLRIVEGQVLDLGFEKRGVVNSNEYLNMISGKTVAIIRFACAAGASLADAPDEQIAAMDAFGNSIGVGFQIQDDLLGAWGASEDTGKPVADDIRQGKKTYPIVLLLEQASPEERAWLVDVFNRRPVDDSRVETILDLLHKYEIRDQVEQAVQEYHNMALRLLDSFDGHDDAIGELRTLVNRLTDRST